MGVEDRAAEVYVALRDRGSVRAAAVELAGEVLEALLEFGAGEDDEEAREAYAVVRRILEEDLDEEEIREAAARLLKVTSFEPGFADAPERRAALEAAVEVVARDARVQGLTEPVTVRYDEPGEVEAHVCYAGSWHGQGLRAHDMDPESWLFGAADALQEAVMEKTWQVWPVCPDHELGLHLETVDSEDRRGPRADGAFWVCAGEGGHRVARVGALSEGRVE
ncbi:hypothetical protein EDD29_0616 [Actinocorallia herbida]|uniref:Uncharacterized protein n=1 Tax=Actinocorallia herbida TaxID=58109 RepID=A0A3N1CPN2_9ACTN|nr:hypothetical protein [Actinocorallia herbida]ROO83124.1 hypothetical protein EDD29_0616 [Actinocorallia herbida]